MEVDLQEQIEAQLRSLRSADTQASAVAWMKKTYLVLERCLREIQDRPTRDVVHERLVFVPERPKLQIVQNIAHHVVRSRPGDETVVYPAMYLHPGLKPAPKPWTRADTLRLERAVKTPKPPIQRQGR